VTPEQLDWVEHQLEIQGAPPWQCQLARRILELPADAKLAIDVMPTRQISVAAEVAVMIEQLAYPDRWLNTPEGTAPGDVVPV